MKNAILVCTAAAILFAGPALASHCDDDIADVGWALAGTTGVEPNVRDAAETLLERAISACQQEEEGLEAGDMGALADDPGYVTLGRSMLISAKDLLDAN